MAGYILHCAFMKAVFLLLIDFSCCTFSRQCLMFLMPLGLLRFVEQVKASSWIEAVTSGMQNFLWMLVARRNF